VYIVKNVVGALGLAAGDQPAADDDPAFRERDLLANLRQDVPTRLLDGRRDEFRANVAFGEIFLVHIWYSQVAQANSLKLKSALMPDLFFPPPCPSRGNPDLHRVKLIMHHLETVAHEIIQPSHAKAQRAPMPAGPKSRVLGLKSPRKFGSSFAPFALRRSPPYPISRFWEFNFSIFWIISLTNGSALSRDFAASV